jgi:nucleoside-diphosphate-sugar epimerase
VGEMIDMILAETGRRIDVVVDPAKVRATERTNLCGTTSRLKKLIGYAPEPASRETIRAILNEAKLRIAAAAAVEEQ